MGEMGDGSGVDGGNNGGGARNENREREWERLHRMQARGHWNRSGGIGIDKQKGRPGRGLRETEKKERWERKPWGQDRDKGENWERGVTGKSTKEGKVITRADREQTDEGIKWDRMTNTVYKVTGGRTIGYGWKRGKDGVRKGKKSGVSKRRGRPGAGRWIWRGELPCKMWLSVIIKPYIQTLLSLGEVRRMVMGRAWGWQEMEGLWNGKGDGMVGREKRSMWLQ